MKYKPIANLLQHMMLALFMVLPGFAVAAQTPNDSGADKNSVGKALPPIDQNPPKVFDTAAFGLG